MQILRDYISYARAYIHPKLCEEAGQALIQAYVDMRKVGSSRGAVTAYPRQLESLIRLSESHARMRLVVLCIIKYLFKYFLTHYFLHLQLNRTYVKTI